MSALAMAMMVTTVMIHMVDVYVACLRGPTISSPPVRARPHASPPAEARVAPPPPASPVSAPLSAPSPTPPFVATADEAPPPSIFQVLAPGEHRPLQLLALARRLALAGTGVTSTLTQLGDNPFAYPANTAAFSRVRVAPVQSGGRTAALRLLEIPPHSILEQLGLRDGDTLLSINGFTLPGLDATPMSSSWARDRLAVVEVLRNGRHAMLAVSWDTLPQRGPTPQPGLARSPAVRSAQAGFERASADLARARETLARTVRTQERTTIPHT